MGQEPLVYLASQSPRRRALLDQLGVSYRVVSVAVDETPRAGEDAPAFVGRMARAKAEAALSRHHDLVGRSRPRPVLAADTAVIVEGRILGKPRDRDDALAMLLHLAGRTHQVLTGVALLGSGTDGVALSRSRVRFRPFTAAEAAAYWETGEPWDKAGAYAIQGRGALFVARIAGSYSGIMGLPLFETGRLLASAGIQLLGPAVE